MSTAHGTSCSPVATPYSAGSLAALLDPDAQATFPELFMMMNKAPLETWMPGAIVPGTVYRVIRPLGSGGMGDVYEAEHELLGVRRAIKVLSRRLAGREDLAERLRVEARALANLRHPNLVEVNDLGVSSDGRLFFAMELLVGSTLREVLQRNGRLKSDQAVGIATQVLDALGAAHERGMIHRDVKPENIFVLQNGSVKLLDFGIAKAIQGNASGPALTAAGMAVGTPRYMAPEQAQGHAVDARTDLYAVGVVLWEMLAGRPPFHDLDPVAAAVASVTRGLPSIEAEKVDAPESVLEALRRVTSRDPAERHRSAAALSAELRHARARSIPPSAIADKITIRYDENATSLVPLIGENTPGFASPTPAGVPPSASGAWEPNGPTAVDGLPAGALAGLGSAPTEMGPDTTRPGMDLRGMPTPTSVPVAPRNEGAAGVPTGIVEPGRRPFWLAAPIALALVLVGLAVAKLTQPVAETGPREPTAVAPAEMAPSVVAQSTPSAPPPASADPQVEKLEEAAPAASGKRGARGAPAKQAAPLPKPGKPLPGSGL